MDGTVFIVDDEEAVRDSIALLMRSIGLSTRGYPDAMSFLSHYSDDPGCLLLDVRMPRMSGLELQLELNRRGWPIPVVFITGHGDVPMAVEAMRAGAVDFLQKPFNDDELIRRVQNVLEMDRAGRESLRERQVLLERYQTLTTREQDIAQRVLAGHANKVIALDLGLSDRTVEQHRANAMQKMGARSLAQFVRIMMNVNT